MARYLDEHEVAEQLETHPKNVVRLVDHGLLRARQDGDGGLLIQQADVGRFRTRWGTNVEQALDHAEQGSTHSKGQSTFMLAVLQSVAWAIVILGILGILGGLVSRNFVQAGAALGLVLLGFSYLVFYDLILSVFAIRRSLEQIAVDVAALQADERRKSAM